MTEAGTVREHVRNLLQQKGAHAGFDRVIAGLPPELRGVKPKGIPYSPWQLLEHMRICQWDILEYCRNPQHISPSFPDGYWPDSGAAPSDRQWQQSINNFRADLEAMQELVGDTTSDLTAQIPHGEPGHTILREALLVADHNAYHLGQLVVVRRALGAWQE